MEEVSGQEVRERERTQLDSEHQVLRTTPDTGTADAALASEPMDEKETRKEENNEKVCMIVNIDHEPDGIYINRVT